MDLADIGVHPAITPAGELTATFGLYLPGITDDRFTLEVLLIHEQDQFDRQVPPQAFPLSYQDGHPLGLWQQTISLDAPAGGAGHFGQPGTYLYRYRLLQGGRIVVPWFTDPFARATGIGSLSAFSIGAGDAFADGFPWTDDAFVVPELDHLVVYELAVAEFNRDFAGVVTQLDYLAGLGVSCLELMPVTNVPEKVEWGYTPLGYFAPDERLGGPAGLKALVDAAHQRGIAVIIDAVYGHCHPEFAYNRVYGVTGVANPMLGDFEGQFADLLGPDYRLPLARDFFHAVNEYWLETYHVDGFRYDYVPGFYDGPLGVGYSELVHHTYRASLAIPRFQTAAGRSRIIQCAEHLPDPRQILSKTYSNACWQNEWLETSRAMARDGNIPDTIGHRLDPQLGGFPDTYHNPATNETFPVAPFQYLETHDHGRFLNEFGQVDERDPVGQAYGDRALAYRTQPFVIALFTAKGIPMLWEGQELGENWGLPGGTDIRRVLYERPVHWEYFYDPIGKALVRLYRRLGELRRTVAALGAHSFLYYENDPEHRARGLVVYRRHTTEHTQVPGEIVLVVLNFRDQPQQVEFAVPLAGHWHDLLDADQPQPVAVDVAQPGDRHVVQVPSNYGLLLTN